MTASTAVTAANPWLNHAATISAIKSETPGVATYNLVIDDPAIADRYEFRPGQFNMIYVPGVGESAISISGAAMPGIGTSPIIHTIREAGNVTRALAELREGDSVGLRGPFGSSWPLEHCIGKDIVLVTGGIGLAPLRPVVYEIFANREQFGNVSLLVGARSPQSLLYGAELSTWGALIDVQQTVDRADSEWNGHVGVVTTLLERLPIESPENTVLMTCGPEVMMWYTLRTALGRGISEQSLWVSLERNMNCAIGMCGHCQLGPHFLCKDGSILRYDRVAATMKVEGL